MKSIPKLKAYVLFLISLITIVSFFLTACKMKTSSEELPRNQKIPLFDPHVASYICSPTKLPILDAQADAWFQEARALESPEIYVDDRDYKKIVLLTRQAAERSHWKAMLNLASLYLERRDPNHHTEDAIALVEQAMRLGIPAAFDRMGTYYMNGTGVRADATRAYAFWQLAAKMGNPEALTFLGAKLISVDDHPERSEWANETVGTKMLECAYSQGYGLAAYELAFQYSIPTYHKPSRAEMAQALKILHEGVKFGSQKCAAKLASEFSAIRPPEEMVAPYLDNAREERYRVLSRALDFDPDRRFPNLDKILPLPPGELPPWNGDSDLLVKAARGVSHTLAATRPPGDHLGRKGRFFLASEYRLVPTEDITEEASAPFTGYWQPIIDDGQPQQDSTGKPIEPGLYQIGEHFERLPAISSKRAQDNAPSLRWRNWRTVRHDQETVPPTVVSGQVRLIERPVKLTACRADDRCPMSGTWQPWMHAKHPLQDAVNQHWRQAWLEEGQRFPHPKLDWLLDVAPEGIAWYLMDCRGVDICPA